MCIRGTLYNNIHGAVALPLQCSQHASRVRCSLLCYVCFFLYLLQPVLLFAKDKYINDLSEANGFYQSTQNGSWHQLTSWVYSPDKGLTPWKPATIIPDERASGILVKNGTTITVAENVVADDLLIEVGAALQITAGQFRVHNGTALQDLQVQGSLSVSGTGNIITTEAGIFFSAGAVYDHGVDGQVVPQANWSPGSTCQISGMRGQAPLGLGQAFAHFIWNCANQINSFFLNDPAFSVSEMFTLSSTGTGRFVFAQQTTEDLNYHIANIQIQRGTMQLSHLSSEGAGKVIVSVTGNISIANDPAAAFIFADGNVTPSSFRYVAEVLLNGDLNVAGSSALFQSSSTLPLAQGRVVMQGTAQHLGLVGGGLARRGKVDFFIASSSHVRLLAPLLLFGGTRMDVIGTLDNNGEHQIISGAGTPAAVLSIQGKFITRDEQGFTGSNAAIPGLQPVLISNSTIEYGRAGNQLVQARGDYSNITFSASGIKTLGNACVPVGQVFITEQAIFDQRNFDFGNEQTRMRMDGGRWRMAGTGTKPDIQGTYQLLDGVIEFTNRAATSQTIRGRLPTGTIIAYPAIEISGTNVQNSNSNITLASGGSFTILDQGVFRSTDNSLVGPNGLQHFIMQSGSKFICISTGGFYGPAAFPNPPFVRSDIETVILQPNSSIVFGRQGTQQISAIGTQPITDYQDMEIAGGGLKTLVSAISIKGALSLVSGILQTSATNLLTLAEGATANAGSQNAFVNGPLCKIGNEPFLFPIGTLVGEVAHYRPIGISNITAASSFTAAFVRSNAMQWSIQATGLQSVSQCEYWNLQQNGHAQASVTLMWNEQSPCNVPEAYVTNPATTVVAQHDGNSWHAYAGSGSGEASPGEGSVTGHHIQTFHRFALGSTSAGQLVLSNFFTKLSLLLSDAGIMLTWSLQERFSGSYFLVEHGVDGSHFSVIKRLPHNRSTPYRFLHHRPVSAWNYYRIRLVLQNGADYVSEVVRSFFADGETPSAIFPILLTKKSG